MITLHQRVTQRYPKFIESDTCEHPNLIRTVRTNRYGTRRHVHIARCPDCPALLGSLTGPPYLQPWRRQDLP